MEGDVLVVAPNKHTPRLRGRRQSLTNPRLQLSVGIRPANENSNRMLPPSASVTLAIPEGDGKVEPPGGGARTACSNSCPSTTTTPRALSDRDPVYPGYLSNTLAVGLTAVAADIAAKRKIGAAVSVIDRNRGEWQ